MSTQLVAAGDDEVGEPIPEPRRPAARRALLSVALVLVAAGVVVHLRLMLSRETPINSDEATVGLMALRLLKHGEFHTFYWNQHYGGGLESVLIAPFVWLFGTTRVGLRTASLLIGFATPWLTWRVAKHLVRPVQAACAGLLALFWPLGLIWFGVQERDFYTSTAALGMSAVLMAVNINEEPRSARHWIGLGFAVGLGFWTSPNIIYYAVPMFAWLVVRGQWRQPRNAALAGVAFVVGCAPWIRTNLHTHFASLAEQQNLAGNSTFGSRFRFFWTGGLPNALGLRAAPFSPTGWYLEKNVAIALYVLALAAIVWVIARSPIKNAPDAYLLAFAPFIWATLNVDWRLVEGRNTYFLASILPLVFARVLERRVGVVFVAALITFCSIGFVRAFDRLNSPSPSVSPMISRLEQMHVHTVIASYWIAYVMTYQSDERIIATSIRPMVGARYQPYIDAVRDSSPAYVFYDRAPRTSEESLLKALAAEHIGYRTVKVPGYVAVVPDRKIVRPV